MEKKKRDDAVASLRERLAQIDPSVRPSSVLRDDRPAKEASTLPSIGTKSNSSSVRERRKSSPPNYREVMEMIRRIQKERTSFVDPYMANLKVRIVVGCPPGAKAPVFTRG